MSDRKIKLDAIILELRKIEGVQHVVADDFFNPISVDIFVVPCKLPALNEIVFKTSLSVLRSRIKKALKGVEWKLLDWPKKKKINVRFGGNIEQYSTYDTDVYKIKAFI